jgi:hypothetical protein
MYARVVMPAKRERCIDTRAKSAVGGLRSNLGRQRLERTAFVDVDHDGLVNKKRYQVSFKLDRIL